MKTSTTALACVLVAAILSSSRDASAQAWADEKGTLNLTLGGAFQFSDAIFYGEFGKITGLGNQSLRSTFGVELTPIDKLTAGFKLTGELDRYTGAQMGASPDIIVAHGEHDDGEWHGALSDGELNVRYQVYDGAVAISPHLRFKVPLTDYETVGYAIPGTGLMELGIGADVGRFGLGSDSVFVSGGYTFNLVQQEDAAPETEEFSVHYSDVRAQGGYLITDSLAAILGLNLVWTHGGVELDEINMEPVPVFENHDGILARRYLVVSAAGNYSISESLSATLLAGLIVWGENVSDAKVFGFNLTWSKEVL